MKKNLILSYTFFLSFASIATSTPVQWSVGDGGNEHYYEAVYVPEGISWTDSDVAATAKGYDWHLVTITSAEENAFVYSLIIDDPDIWNCCLGGQSSGPWLGGYYVGPTKDDYAWVTDEPFVYTNWGPSEPYGNGDRISFYSPTGTTSPYWNDVADYQPSLTCLGYIVESETVPEPATLLLLGLGGLMLRRCR